MKSKIADAVHLHYPPVALLWTDQRPADATQFKAGKWGCVIWMLANAARGKTAVFDRKTFGCVGGGVGLGFGNLYQTWAGGIECFYNFLSIGNEGTETGRQLIEKIRPFLRAESLENFIHGEGYKKTPALVKDFVDNLPIIDIPATYVVFKPLAEIEDPKEVPKVVIFLADPDQLSALIVLANYGRTGLDNVIVPQAAGCQSIGILPLREANSDRPRAVIGLNDLSARVNLRKLGENLMTFAVPFSMFQEMEADVEGSFLQKDTWNRLLQMKGLSFQHEEFRRRLQEILLGLSFKVGAFTLSSGKTSDYYVDCRTTTLDPEGADLVARLFFQRIITHDQGVDAVGGLTLGADPLTAGLIVRSQLEGRPVRGFIVRKEAKGHGRGRQIEGNLRPDDRVVILEDVVTTAGSALQAIAAVEAEGAKVIEVMALVDREEGGREALQAKGYPLFALFTASELKAAAKAKSS